MNEWLYWDKCSPEDYEGFVYKITNLQTQPRICHGIKDKVCLHL